MKVSEPESKIFTRFSFLKTVSTKKPEALSLLFRLSRKHEHLFANFRSALRSYKLLVPLYTSCKRVASPGLSAK